MFLHRKLNPNEKRSFAGGVTAKNSPLFLATDSSNKLANSYKRTDSVIKRNFKSTYLRQSFRMSSSPSCAKMALSDLYAG